MNDILESKPWMTKIPRNEIPKNKNWYQRTLSLSIKIPKAAENIGDRCCKVVAAAKGIWWSNIKNIVRAKVPTNPLRNNIGLLFPQTDIPLGYNTAQQATSEKMDLKRIISTGGI